MKNAEVNWNSVLKLSHADKTDIASWTCEHAVQLIKSEDAKMGYRMLQKIAMDMPDHGEACALLGRTYAELGDRHRAMAFLRRAATLIPNDAKVWSLMGMLHYRYKNLSPALVALEKSVALNPKSGIALVLMSMVKHDLKHDANEVEDLSRRATQCDPKNLHAWQWLAAILEAVGKSEESDAAHLNYCNLVTRQPDESLTNGFKNYMAAMGAKIKSALAI